MEKAHFVEPLVSIIIPTYNRPHYLEQALESAVSQKYKNIEIIISDNCSPCNPESLVKSFNDPRIKFYRNEQNIGLAANFKKAFLLAKGKYVASLLDDDAWDLEFLSKLVPPLEENSSLALSFCDHFIMDENGKVDTNATQKCSRENNRANLLGGVYQPFYDLALVTGAISTAMAAVIRRDIIDWNSIPLDVGSAWDVYVSYSCCVNGLGTFYHPEKLTYVREHSQSFTQQSGWRNVQTKIQKSKAHLFCYELIILDQRLKIFKPYFRQRVVAARTSLGIGLMRAGDLREARLHLWQSFRQKFSWETLALLILSYTHPCITRNL